jgi:hypothetical protein
MTDSGNFDHKQQQQSVFPFGASTGAYINKLCLASAAFAQLVAEVKEALCEPGSPWKPEDLEACQAHVLFGYAQESHFAFHKDSNTFKNFVPNLAAVCHLTSGVASMYVAGAAQDLEYKGCGECSFFDTELWHRSGRSEHGTIRVTFFFKIKTRVKVKKGGEDEEEEGKDTIEGRFLKKVKREDEQPDEVVKNVGHQAEEVKNEEVLNTWAKLLQEVGKEVEENEVNTEHLNEAQEGEEELNNEKVNNEVNNEEVLNEANDEEVKNKVKNEVVENKENFFEAYLKPRRSIRKVMKTPTPRSLPFFYCRVFMFGTRV